MERDQAHRTNELLLRIAVALEKNNVTTTPKPKDIPGFEGTLDALDNLCNLTPTSDNPDPAGYGIDERDEDDIELQTDYVFDLIKNMTKEQYVKFYLEMDFGFALSDTEAFTEHIVNDLEYDEVLDVITAARNVLDTPTNLHYVGKITPIINKYVHGVINDEDNDIRSTAYSYEAALDSETQLTTKKDCILDYVTNEFGILGARYTDIIKFAYYLGEPNAPKYDNANRGYYSQAFSTRTNGHLITGGKDCLVKGINKEGVERYFALSSVDSFTDYYKRIK
jgi:hypothetical protein